LNKGNAKKEEVDSRGEYEVKKAKFRTLKNARTVLHQGGIVVWRPQTLFSCQLSADPPKGTATLATN
jgi:hypothetical protein